MLNLFNFNIFSLITRGSFRTCRQPPPQQAQPPAPRPTIARKHRWTPRQSTTTSSTSIWTKIVRFETLVCRVDVWKFTCLFVCCVAIYFWLVVGVLGCCVLLCCVGLIVWCMMSDADDEKVEDYSMRDASELDYFDDEYIWSTTRTINYFNKFKILKNEES